MMMVTISLKVIICKSAYLKALKFISAILCVCSLTPQPIPSINPFTARVHEGVWSQVDHPLFVCPLLLMNITGTTFHSKNRFEPKHSGEMLA